MNLRNTSTSSPQGLQSRSLRRCVSLILLSKTLLGFPLSRALLKSMPPVSPCQPLVGIFPTPQGVAGAVRLLVSSGAGNILIYIPLTLLSTLLELQGLKTMRFKGEGWVALFGFVFKERNQVI